MAIEAPLCKFKKTNIKIYIVVCIVAAVWFGYDGYFSESFRETHTKADGTPDGTLAFNQKAPPVFFAGAVFFGAYLFAIKNRKIVADENELVITAKEKVPYDSIQKIDKTHFESKSYFVVTYNDKDGREANLKLSSRRYDNLAAVLEHLVAKIS